MPTKTFWLFNASAAGSNFLRLDEGSAPADSDTLSVFSVLSLAPGTGAAEPFARDTTVNGLQGSINPPDAPSNVAASNAWRTEKQYSGSFAAGFWTVFPGMILSGADGWWDTAVYKGPDATGSGAALVVGGGGDGGITVPAFQVNNEYVFVSVAWHAFQDGGATSAVSHTMHVGATNGTFITTTDFSPLAWARSLGPFRFGNPNPVSRFRSRQAWDNGTVAIPATALAAPGIVTGSFPAGQASGAAQVAAAPGTATGASPSGKATGGARVGALAGAIAGTSAPGHAFGAGAQVVDGGGAFGQDWVAIYRPAPPKPPKAPKPVSTPAVARAAPGQGYTHSAPGRAIGERPPDVIAARVAAAPGLCFSQSAPGQALGARAVIVGAQPGIGTSSTRLGRAGGAAAVSAATGVARSTSRPGAASGAATVLARVPESRAAARPGAAVGLHNPTDEQLVAAALLLDDTFDSLEA